jgi:hypothetical protein
MPESRRRLVPAPTLARIGAIMLMAACSPAPSSTSVASGGMPTEAPASRAAAVERSPDGIPTIVDGRPVLRGQAALDFADAQADATSFLVGGWVTYYPGTRLCPIVPEDESGSWTRDCGPARFTDVAGTVDEELTNAITFHFVLEGLRTGPVIAEVHVHDPRAGECGAARAACDALMVVERAIWTGDDARAAGPLTAAGIADVLVAAQGSRDMRAMGDGSVFTDCGSELPSAQLFSVESGNALTPGVTLVELEPTIDAMRRAAPANAVECETQALINGVMTSTDHRWLVVANAALLVRTNGEPTGKDLAFIDRLGLMLGQLAATE